MQVFPEKIRNLWNRCEVRVMIILSLLLQIILIIFGNRRKLTARIWIRVIVWSAYMTADWVATVALGNLASTKGDSKDSTKISYLQQFWAPFLLLHMGGPDTITAYALEDNELWLRHFLGLIVQVGVAFYVFLKAWGNTALTFLAIPIFISGIIKYGERTYILMSSSREHFKDTLGSNPAEQDMDIPQDSIQMEEDRYLVQAYSLFRRSEFFFAERTLDENERQRIYSIFKYISPSKAFEMIAVELGFMYDVLYTKATMVYRQLGIVLRCITFFCSLSAFVVFSTFIDIHVHPLIDISITYLLLVGAVLLELYAIILLFLSDWAKVWFIKLKTTRHGSISKTLGHLFWRLSSHSQSLSLSRKKWSESMGQYNLLSSCLIKKVQWLENKQLTWTDVNNDHLQKEIISYLREQGRLADGSYVATNPMNSVHRDLILDRRGNNALEKRSKFLEFKYRWCTTSIEFVDSLVVWHIATDMHYHGDHQDDTNKDDREVSKILSNYMLYLLKFRPSMLPKGIGEIRFKDTCDEVITLLQKKKLDYPPNKSKACDVLVNNYGDLSRRFGNLFQENENYTADFNEFFKAERPSLLKYGIMLSTLLQSESLRWTIMRDVWVEMLAYAANNCGWKEHAQQLRRGGELLTHVCLLMTHFGLSKQYFNDVLLKVNSEGFKSSEAAFQIEAIKKMSVDMSDKSSVGEEEISK